jgi:hypothetical protein
MKRDNNNEKAGDFDEISGATFEKRPVLTSRMNVRFGENETFTR